MTLRFESPRNARDVAGCAFYDYMDLPRYRAGRDHWDLRPTIDAGMVLPHLRDPFRALQSGLPTVQPKC